MKKVVRAQYRAAIREDAGESELLSAFDKCGEILEGMKGSNRIYTAGFFRYRTMLFFHAELISESSLSLPPLQPSPDVWFAPLNGFLKSWPEKDGDVHWAAMFPVFWFDEPAKEQDLIRSAPPEKRCGRIAVLHPDKAMSYICHHQAIVKEGLLKGDRYQFISIHGNILFSYFETPRDREWVNIKRCDENSKAIQRWMDADPDSHFVKFPEAKGENFLVIETVLSI